MLEVVAGSQGRQVHLVDGTRGHAGFGSDCGDTLLGSFEIHPTVPLSAWRVPPKPPTATANLYGRYGAALNDNVGNDTHLRFN